MGDIRGDGWAPMQEAPTDRPIQVRTAGGYILKAQLFGGFIDSDENDCSCWCAVDVGTAPPSWTDDVCWASNEDEQPSDPPVAWRPCDDALTPHSQGG